MPKLTVKRVVLGTVAAVLLGSFVPPLLNVNRYRADVASAIGRAVGRDVSVGGVSLRAFPQPGFALSNFVVADDPSFSAEPMILAQDVTANLRLSSLWRGRLEIASLSLSYPSLNLVRRADGSWNVETLLERATRSETAPTATKPESRPRFPYIEAEGGRINLKLGQEKKAYALTDADFALWLASEREWRVRLAAQPMRTDDNLSDTGTLRVSGSFGAAAELMDTPLELTLTLERAQLGQFTRLIYGFDSGWRGAVDATFALRGSPANLKVAAQAAVDDLHRYDVYGANGLRLATRCTAQVSATAQELRDVVCNSALGSGTIHAKGEAQWAAHNRHYQLSVVAEELPANLLLGAARRMEKDMPRNLEASGVMSAAFELSSTQGALSRWRGGGRASDLVLASTALAKPVTLGDIRFELVPAAASGTTAGAEQSLRVAPIAVELGGASPATVQAWFSRSGYRVLMQGETKAEQALPLARAVGIPVPAAEVEGSAQIDFELKDTWSGEEPPSLAGTARIGKLTADIEGVGPLAIAAGRLVVSPSRVLIQNASFSLPELSLKAAGWVRKPRNCSLMNAPPDSDGSTAGKDSSASCLLEFSLTADQVPAGKLEQLLAPPRPRRRWYRLAQEERVSPLLRMHAAGTLRVGAIEGGSFPVRRLRTQVQWQQGLLKLGQLRADLWQGQHRGDIQADFRSDTPTWEWHGELRQVLLQEMTELPAKETSADLTPEGRLTVRGGVKATGLSSEQARLSASGSVEVDLRGGVLPRLALNGEDGPLRVRHLHGEIEIKAGEVAISEGMLQTAEGSYELSGTANLSRELKLRLEAVDDHATTAELRGGVLAREAATKSVEAGSALNTKVLSITGTLEHPIVEDAPAPAPEATGPLASASKKVVKGAKEARSRVAAGAGAALAPANAE